MENIVVVADWAKVVSPKKDLNEEKSYDKGADSDRICVCCGREIKNIKTAKYLHLIEGGSYLTEDERVIDEKSDMGWWIVGATCYNKFLKNRKEVKFDG